jgi:tetraacyldisaccharide 4'-kinase
MRRLWLAPFVPIYAAGTALADLSAKIVNPRRLAWPVISIGNLSTGGSGKTPLTIALAQLLTARGVAVDILSRGYGREDQSTAAQQVDPDGDVAQFGDEPLLIARATGLPVYIAPQRYQAGLLAEAGERANPSRQKETSGSRDKTAGQVDSSPSQRPHAHILDDGFQHRQLARTVDILLLDRTDFHDTLLPAGNLREALHAAKRADILAIPADDPAFEAELRAWGWTGPIWRLRRTMDIPFLAGPVLAFCGVARPEQFFSGLAAAGLRLARRIAFPDHHAYLPRDIKRLNHAAKGVGAVAILTTEKDKVRMKPASLACPLIAVPLRTEIEDEPAAINCLIGKINAPQAL